MNTQTEQKLLEKPILVWLKNAVFISIAIWCILYLFFDHLLPNFSINKSEKEMIATLAMKENTIRAKRDGSEAWRNIQESELLYLNDQIFTQENSTGILKFEDGTTLELAPKTLIKLSKKENVSSVDLLEGNFLASLKSNQGLIIKSGEKEFSLSGEDTSFQLSKNENGDGNVQILSGEAVIEIDGKKMRAGDHQIIVMKGGKLAIVDLPVVFDYPKNGSWSYYNHPDKKEILFQWRVMDPEYNDREWELVVATDETFENIVHKETTRSLQTSVPIKNDGKYWFKVIPKAPPFEKALFLTYHCKTASFTAPQMLSPKSTEIITLSKDYLSAPPLTLLFENKGFDKIAVTVEREDKPLIEKDITSLELPIKFTHNPSGRYTVKTRGIKFDRPDKITSPSALFYFDIELGTGAVTPENLLPESTAIIASPALSRSRVEFNWHGESFREYQLDIAADAEFEVLIESLTVKGLKAEIPLKSFGEFYWRVSTQKFSNQKTRVYSLATRFTHTASAPKNYYPPESSQLVLYRPQGINFKWYPVETSLDEFLASGKKPLPYLIQVSRDPQFEKIINKKISADPASMWQDPQFGQLFWRTKVNLLSAPWSEVSSFSLEKSMSPKPPVLPEQVESVIIRK